MFHKKEDIARYGTKEVQAYRRNIGVVYQDFKLIERKNVAENIAYPLEIAGIGKKKRNEKVDQILKLLELEDKKKTKIPLLSGGEKQRVAIGRALINNPEFIIADEPTGNLDRENSKKIAQTLIKLNKQGNTIVLITHDQQLMQRVNKHHDTKTIELG
jgi:cell division transport system ATP-binding protein